MPVQTAALFCTSGAALQLMQINPSHPSPLTVEFLRPRKILSINATVERDGELKEADWVIGCERYSGAVSRTFSLASDVNENHSRSTVLGWSAIADVAGITPSAQKRLLIN
ncbi:Hsp20/alpha crystallin family protein [Paraburkholderia sp. RL17-373-BIF-A]|uniref:hypothetical protein n=1 Tax=Paraburkholderia sp. RL17-373-BIF-A TaxID=3031629 RepID=UPI0038B760E7